MSSNPSLPPFSRRSFLQLSAAASTMMAAGFWTEPMLAQVAVERGAYPDGAIRINSNENPLGPCAAARDAVASTLPKAGRYEFHLTEELIKTYAEQQGVKKEYLMLVDGSTPALNYAVGAFTSPKASYVAAEPGYDGVAHAAQAVGARVVGVQIGRAHV